MNCEVCGKTIRGISTQAVIEGANLIVCSNCADLASATWKKTPPFTASTPPRRVKKKTQPQTPRKPLEDEELQLIEKYGAKVKAVREKLGWTQEDLGRKVNVKSSLIAKIETERIEPEIPVLRKLEHTLDLILLTKIGQNIALNLPSTPAGKLTLGDTAVIKRREQRNAS